MRFHEPKIEAVFNGEGPKKIHLLKGGELARKFVRDGWSLKKMHRVVQVYNDRNYRLTENGGQMIRQALV